MFKSHLRRFAQVLRRRLRHEFDCTGRSFCQSSSGTGGSSSDAGSGGDGDGGNSFDDRRVGRSNGARVRDDRPTGAPTAEPTGGPSEGLEEMERDDVMTTYKNNNLFFDHLPTYTCTYKPTLRTHTYICVGWCVISALSSFSIYLNRFVFRYFLSFFSCTLLFARFVCARLLGCYAAEGLGDAADGRLPRTTLRVRVC